MTWMDKVFAGCAILGGALFLIRLVMFFIGGVGHAMDVDAAGVDAMHGAEGIGGAGDMDAAHGGEAGHDADVSFRLLTFQGITAFFLMFGLVGLALHKQSRAGELLALSGAVAAGVAALYVIAKLFSLMKGLQSSGTLNLRNAIGQEGAVYLTIPPGGTGKVNVSIQGRLMLLNAVSESKEPIKTGERVKVVNVVSGNIMVVEKV